MCMTCCRSSTKTTPRTRCCVHKERAVLKERICVALGVNEDMNIIDAANKATTEPVDRTQHVIVDEACKVIAKVEPDCEVIR